MDYNLKIVIGGVTFPEAQDTTEGAVKTPSVTNVKLDNSACSKTMEIGATASDRLTFTIINPEKTVFDGDEVTLFIQETDTRQKAKTVEIEETVGSETTSEFIFPENDSVTEENSEEEEQISQADEADAASTQEALAEGLDLALSGEFEETTTETLPDGESGLEWQQIGVYYMFSQINNSDGSITITAYDGFSKMNGTFNPTNYTASIADMFADLQAQALEECGITISDEEFGDIEDDDISIFFTCSYREAIGYFAGLKGGFAEFRQDGTCGISQYAFDDNNLIDTELISYNETSAGEMVVESIACNTTRNALKEDLLEAGSGGQDILFTNPFMTQDILDDIFSDYQGMRFTGAVASVSWDDRMNAGEFVRIFTEDEYANYIRVRNNLEQNSGTLTPAEISELRAGMNQLGKIILISSQTIDFKGDAVTTITSICESETSKANKPLTEVDAKFLQVYEDNIDTRELAVQTRQYAQQAQADATAASQAASAAGQAASDASSAASAASTQAQSAASSANTALTQLSIIENVAGTLNWIQEHGQYVPTDHTTVHDDTVYFIYNSTAQDYEPIISPDPTKNPSTEGWYVLDVTASQSDFIMAHLAVTARGLWVIPAGMGAAQDPRYAADYKMLLSDDGVFIYDAGGNLITTLGQSIIFSDSRDQYIGNNRAYIRFDADENTLSIGGANVVFTGDTPLSKLIEDVNGSSNDLNGHYDVSLSGSGTSINAEDIVVDATAFANAIDPETYSPTSDTEIDEKKKYYAKTAVGSPSADDLGTYYELDQVTGKLTLTTDTEITSGKTYYTVEEVASPDVSDIASYYEDDEIPSSVQLTYDGTDWTYGGSAIDPAKYGIEFDSSASFSSGDTVTLIVDYVEGVNTLLPIRNIMEINSEQNALVMKGGLRIGELELIEVNGGIGIRRWS